VAGGIIQPLLALALARGVSRGSGPTIKMSRVQSITQELQLAAIVQAEEAAEMSGFSPSNPAFNGGAPVTSAPPAAPYGYGSGAPYSPGYLAGAGFGGASGYGPGPTQLAAGGSYHEEGGTNVSIGQLSNVLDQVALRDLVIERRSAVQSSLDAISENGELQPEEYSGYTLGKMASLVRVDSKGWVDALRITGAAGDTVTVYRDPTVGGSVTWDDTDNTTAAAAITGRPVSLIIPEDGWVIVPIREQAPILLLKLGATGMTVTSSIAKSYAHMRSLGVNGFGAPV